MQLENAERNERAVSSVISVILMVAITVILAAVVATFALGFTDGADNTGPTAAFESEYDVETGRLTITHTEGDTVRSDRLRFAGGAQAGQTFGSLGWGDGDGTVESGESVTIDVERDSTVDLVWQDRGDEDGTSAVLQSFDVPDQGPVGSITNLDTADAAGIYNTDPDQNGDVSVTVSARDLGGSVYVEIEDDESGGSYGTATVTGSIDVSGGSGSDDFTTCRGNVASGDIITVTIYKSSATAVQLDQATKQANVISGDYDGGPSC